MEEESTRRRLRVDAISQASEVHATRLKAIHEINEPFDAATKAIELPHNERVTGPEVGERVVEAWPSQSYAAGPVRKDAIAVHFLQSVHLQRQLLVIRRDAGIADRQPVVGRL